MIKFTGSEYFLVSFSLLLPLVAKIICTYGVGVILMIFGCGLVKYN